MFCSDNKKQKGVMRHPEGVGLNRVLKVPIGGRLEARGG